MSNLRTFVMTGILLSFASAGLSQEYEGIINRLESFDSPNYQITLLDANDVEINAVTDSAHIQTLAEVAYRKGATVKMIVQNGAAINLSVGTTDHDADAPMMEYSEVAVRGVTASRNMSYGYVRINNQLMRVAIRSETILRIVHTSYETEKLQELWVNHNHIATKASLSRSDRSAGEPHRGFTVKCTMVHCSPYSMGEMPFTCYGSGNSREEAIQVLSQCAADSCESGQAVVYGIIDVNMGETGFGTSGCSHRTNSNVSAVPKKFVCTSRFGLTEDDKEVYAAAYGAHETNALWEAKDAAEDWIDTHPHMHVMTQPDYWIGKPKELPPATIPSP